MDNKKFCFIICSNSKLHYSECSNYIGRLHIPEGYSVEILEINDAKSMTSGYNEGMKASDAKYKIYMHQDVYIVYPYFLFSILDIFKKDNAIGMIGMVGAKQMSVNGVMWHNPLVGDLYGFEKEKREKNLFKNYKYNINDGIYEAETIDGLMMITSIDLPWREDLFTGWDFYDASQSFEMRKQGYKIAVPVQKVPWVIHEDGVLNLRNYNKYREVFIREYGDMIR